MRNQLIEIVTPKWPEVLIRGCRSEQSIESIVRINRGGKWYLVKVKDSIVIPDFDHIAIDSAPLLQYQKFIIEVNKVIYFYQLLETPNEELNPIDPDQRPEEERLRELYGYKKHVS